MIRTASIDRHPWGSDGYVRPQSISLPAEPFAIPPADRDETAPRSMPIRGKDTFNINLTMGPRTMQLFQYAESQGWKCTVNQAADAIGMNVKSAQSLAIKAGFLNRFAGYHAKPTMRERENDNASKGALGGFAAGFDVDENLLPIDRLIR